MAASILFAAGGCGKDSKSPARAAPNPAEADIPVPHAGQADLAIAAVQAYKPAGATVSISSVEATDKLLAPISGTPFKDIGWGAQAQGSGWLVTWEYINPDGKEVGAQWSVSLPSNRIMALNSHSESVENAARRESHVKS